MKLLTLAPFAVLCGLGSASAAEPTSATAPSNAPGQAQAAPITPANDPAYVYKTLRLNRAAFDALASRPEQLLVLDIRRPDELTNIGGFPVYLSIQTNEVPKYLAFIPRDRIIVTVSNRAHRAGAVGDLLSSYGFHVAGAIGVKDYEDEGGAIAKITPPPKTVATQSPATGAASR